MGSPAPTLSRLTCASVLACAVLIASVAKASPASVGSPVESPAPVRAVEPGVADLGPLSASHRVPRAEQRAPFDFDRVERADEPGAALMRRSGALRAVFPRSEYATTRDGVVILIPAGTVFRIGPSVQEPNAPPGPESPGGAHAASDRRVNTRIDGASRSAPGARPQALELSDRRPRPSDRDSDDARSERAPAARAVSDRLIMRTMSDESYRRQRLRQLSDELRPGR